MNPVLEDRAVLDQVQPPPGTLALCPQPWCGQPDRRHQIPERQLRQDPRADLVGLARQRRQPLDPLRVSDQHHPYLTNSSCTNRAPFIDSTTPRP